MTRRSFSESERTRRSVVASFAGIALAGCMGAPGGDSTTDGTRPADTRTAGDRSPVGDPPDSGRGGQPASQPGRTDVTETTVVRDLEVPWDLVFAGSDAFFTEREVGLRRLDAEALLSGADLGPDAADLVLEPSDVPDFENPQFGGFLGVAAHPGYPDPPVIYLYHSSVVDYPQNRVIRYDLEQESIAVVVDDIPGTGGHLGGRIAFGPEDNLWITTGDANEPDLAQDPSSRAGAVLRVTEAGEVPPGNPSYDDGDPRTMTYGHRNPQGLAFTPGGEVVVTEHGPDGRDEVALVTPGANYGWPTARGGPDDPDYDAYTEHEAFTPPVVNTGPETTWAPSGGTFYTGDAIAGWTHRLLVSGLISETLYAVTFVEPGEIDADLVGDEGVRFEDPWLDDRYDAIAHPFYEEAYGRLRHAAQGPNGSVFLLTSNRDGRASDPFPADDDDRIVRIDPT